MKRDWKLCEALLTAAENYDGRSLVAAAGEKINRPWTLIEYHRRILGLEMGNAGYISEDELLTWEGHEALERMRAERLP